MITELNGLFEPPATKLNEIHNPSFGINGNGCTGSIEIGVNIGSISSLKSFFRFFFNH